MEEMPVSYLTSNLFFFHSWGGVDVPELHEGRPDPVGPGHRRAGAQLRLGARYQRADQSEGGFPR